MKIVEFTWFLTYCGCTISYGIASDSYGYRITAILVDPIDLVASLKTIPTQTLLRFIDEYDEFMDWLEAHRNVCSAIDCQNVRQSRKFEFVKQWLDILGIPYTIKSATSCFEPDEYDKLRSMIDKYDIIDLYNAVLDELYTRGVDIS